MATNVASDNPTDEIQAKAPFKGFSSRQDSVRCISNMQDANGKHNMTESSLLSFKYAEYTELLEQQKPPRREPDARDQPSSGELLSSIILHATAHSVKDYREEFGWYKYRRFIGEGAYFSVEALKNYEHKLVAIKRLKQNRGTEHGDQKVDSLSAALQELRVLTHPPLRNHAHVIRLLGHGWTGPEDAPEYYMVQELAEGNLRQYLKTSKVAWKQKAQFCLEVAEGLATLHACSIVHCDMKQENVLVVSHPSRGPVCKISDFGHSISSRSKVKRFMVRSSPKPVTKSQKSSD